MLFILLLIVVVAIGIANHVEPGKLLEFSQGLYRVGCWLMLMIPVLLAIGFVMVALGYKD